MKNVISTIILLSITLALIIGAIIPLAKEMKNTSNTAYSIVHDMNNNLAEPTDEP